ncbi:hypothetical protein Tco_0001367 [Tanacetum coccineum]
MVDRTIKIQTVTLNPNQILTKELSLDMKKWEELIRENVFGLGGHRDRLPACLAHMLYCVVAEEQYNLAYFFVKRIECAKAIPTANLPYGIQTRLPRSDRGKARRSVSSSSSHHQGTSSHQRDDDDDDVETSRANMLLAYGRNPEAELRVDCYCNAGFETDKDKIKSQTGYVFILNGRRSRIEKLQAKSKNSNCGGEAIITPRIRLALWTSPIGYDSEIAGISDELIGVGNSGVWGRRKLIRKPIPMRSGGGDAKVEVPRGVREGPTGTGNRDGV